MYFVFTQCNYWYFNRINQFCISSACCNKANFFTLRKVKSFLRSSGQCADLFPDRMLFYNFQIPILLSNFGKKKRRLTMYQTPFLFRLPCSSRIKFLPVFFCLFGIYSIKSDKSQSSTSHIRSKCSIFNRSATSL